MSTETAQATRLSVEQQALEFERCAFGPGKKESAFDGFKYWCATYCLIEDKETHQAVAFKWYKCQGETAKMLCSGKWLWILKARRLGFTWLLVAYATWLTTFFLNRDVCVLNQDMEYAQDFLERVRFIQDRMPDWMRPQRTTDNKSRITMKANGRGCEIRSFACTKRALRSIAADVVIFDEAAFMDLLRAAKHAAMPAVETGKGMVVGLSTSAGPSGEFYETYGQAASGKGKFASVFYDWTHRPGRTKAWYKQEKEDNEADPLFMKREYPATPEEAFESAEGRVYPLFPATRS